MNQVTTSLSREEIARVEARNADKTKKQKEAAAKSPPLIIDEDGKRRMVLPLNFPIKYDGVRIDQITIRRPSLREWRSYITACAEAVKEHGPGADDDVDMPWMSVPTIVIGALDFIDGERVEAAQEGFFAQSTLLPAVAPNGIQTTDLDTDETETAQEDPSLQTSASG
ncbi:phage tail assembly protein [Brucella sp. TWI432]